MCPQTPTSSIRKDSTSATFSKLAKKDYDISRMCASNTITNCRGISIVPAFQATETTIPCCRDCRSGYSSTEAKHFKLKSMKTKHFFRDWELTRFLIILFILSSLCKEVPAQLTRCQRPGDPSIVEETTPVGTVLLTLPADPDMTWTFEFKSSQNELTQYLELKRNQTDSSFVLTLAKTMDVEEIFGLLGTDFLGVTTFSLHCKEPNRQEKTSAVLLEVREVNEFSPEFNTTSIEIFVKENTALGTPLLNLIDWASDKDINYRTGEISGFSLSASGADSQALQLLQMTDTSRGIISVRQTIDFDALPPDSRRLVLNLQVKDTGGKSGTASLTVVIEDEDDLPPEFFYTGCSNPCSVAYRAFFSPNATGEVDRIEPSPIQAKDGDSLGYGITYHLVQGPENYGDYLQLDPSTAQLSVVKELEGSGLADLALIVEAREVSPAQRFSQANLLITFGVIGGTGAVASAGTDDSILVAAIVLGILFFIVVVCLVVGAIFFRKKYKTPVHPESRQPIRKDESPMAEDSPRGRSQYVPPVHTSGYQHQLLKSEVKENGLLGGEFREKNAMRGDEEVTTWMPIAANNDIVDLSDEDTIKKKKKASYPPTDTKLQGLNFNSSKRTEDGTQDLEPYPETEYAEVDTPPLIRKSRDQAAENPVAMDSPNDLPVMLINKMYGTSAPDPPARHHRETATGPRQAQSEEHEEETEYATPRDTGSVTNYDSDVNNNANNGRNDDGYEIKERKINNLDQNNGTGVYTNKAFTKDEPHKKPPRRPGSKKPLNGKGDRSKGPIGVEPVAPTTNSESQTSSLADDPESPSFQNSDASLTGSGPLYTTENESPQLPPRRQWLSTSKPEKKEKNDDYEETEYSVPTSNRSSYVMRPLPVPDDTDKTMITINAPVHMKMESSANASSPVGMGNKPSLPPKPSPKGQLYSGGDPSFASKGEEQKQVEEPPYATVDKLKKSPTSPTSPSADPNDDADQSGEGECSSANDSSGRKTGSASFALQAPSRRKRPRKRNKQPRAPEEDVYDGTKDYEDLEVDSGFYTDTSKTKIKRSSRLPVMKPDPSDTRYWITVSNDF